MKVLIWCCGFEPRFAGQYVYTEAKRQGLDVQVTGSRNRPQEMLPALYHYKPDVVFCFVVHRHFGNYYKKIQATGAKLVLWYPDMTDVTRDWMWRNSLDNVADALIFSILQTAQAYKELAPTVLWMPQYFDAETCKYSGELPLRLNPHKPIYDLCFIGSCDGLRHGWLNKLTRDYNCRFELDGIQSENEIRGWEMSKIYAQSRIAFNIQRKQFINPGPFVTSNRTYNAMGSGAFFINHCVEQIDLLFKVGTHCLMHQDNFEHLKSLIDQYLANSVDRERIALAGQQNILRFHTLEQRVKEYWDVLLAIVEERQGQLPAGAFGNWVTS